MELAGVKTLQEDKSRLKFQAKSRKRKSEPSVPERVGLGNNGKRQRCLVNPAVFVCHCKDNGFYNEKGVKPVKSFKLLSNMILLDF